MKHHWLFKTEPDVFSIDDLENSPEKITRWDGIRNYQARNLLRDQIKVGDHVFVYHSQCKVPGIIGLAKVVKAAYPDPAQFDPENDYFDPKADADNPRWFCVDIQHKQTFNKVIPLRDIKQHPELHDMVLLKQSRLSIQPVSAGQVAIIKRDYAIK